MSKEEFELLTIYSGFQMEGLKKDEALSMILLLDYDTKLVSWLINYLESR